MCPGSSIGTAAITVSRLALLGPLSLLSACAGTPRIETTADPSGSLLALRAADLRVATIAYRLAVAGEAICPNKERLTGLVLHDASQYAPGLRESARETLGAEDRVGVLAVATGSPAAKAGLLAGDSILFVDGVALSATRPSGKASYLGVAAAYAAFDRVPPRTPVFSVEVARGTTRLGTFVAPVTGCASRVQLRTSPEIEAKADGRVLSVTTALLDYARNDDELALAIAHEMAHNALGHRVALEARGVTPGKRRQSRDDQAAVLAIERIADRFGYYLMARAGFDLGFAPGFWHRLHEGPARSRSAPGTHPDVTDRVAQAAAIAAEISSKQARGTPLIP